jgi:N-acetylglucosamine-6-phosphate deacetylase
VPITFDNATVFTPSEIKNRHAVVVSDDGAIDYVGPPRDAPRHDGSCLDVGGRILAPGFIDIHRHGGVGVAFGMGDDSVAELNKFADWIPVEGITGFLCTIVAPDEKSLIHIISEYVRALEAGTGGAEALGLHLEGPYVDRDTKRGALSPTWLREPSPEEAKSFLEAGNGWIRQITMDPSLPHADEVAALCREYGAVVALGHTDMGYEAAASALRGHFTHVTHTYNCLRGFHHREPGAIGAVLASDHVTAELIPDCYHVHPGAMRVLVRCLGTERIILVSDAIIGSGFEDGNYELVGHTLVVRHGETRLENGTIAGSTTPFNRCVANMHREVGVPLHEAVKMATHNPAVAMGYGDRLGNISPGKDASLVVMDEDVNIYLVMVRGRVVLNNL